MEKEKSYEIVRLDQTKDDIRREAIKVFVESFDIYKRLSKDHKILIEFFLKSFRMECAYACIYEGTVAGMAAICDNKMRSLKFDKQTCIKSFGRIKGRLAYWELPLILSKPNLEHDADIGIDYLATSKEYRKKGIGTKLIEYICDNMGAEHYIDVAGNNEVAKKLYLSLGFQQYDEEKSMITRMLGFGSILRLKRKA